MGVKIYLSVSPDRRSRGCGHAQHTRGCDKDGRKWVQQLDFFLVLFFVVDDFFSDGRWNSAILPADFAAAEQEPNGLSL